MIFVVRLLITAAAVALAAQIFEGIWFDGPTEGWAEIEEKWLPLLIVSLISWGVTSFVKPILTLLSIPFILITLGFFLLVLNAMLLFFIEWLSGLFDLGFHVDGFWTAVGGALVISVTTWILDAIVGVGDKG